MVCCHATARAVALGSRRRSESPSEPRQLPFGCSVVFGADQTKAALQQCLDHACDQTGWRVQGPAAEETRSAFVALPATRSESSRAITAWRNARRPDGCLFNLSPLACRPLSRKISALNTPAGQGARAAPPPSPNPFGCCPMVRGPQCAPAVPVVTSPAGSYPDSNCA